MTVLVEKRGPVTVVTLTRLEVPAVTAPGRSSERTMVAAKEES